MRRHKPQSETDKLNKIVDDLPRRIADWTPEQRQQHAAQSDRAMREQAQQTRKKR